MARHSRWLVALLFALMVATPAVAQGVDDALKAFNALGTGDWTLAQFYATRAIASNALRPGDEAAVYAYRADARRHQNDFTGAIDDYTAALDRGLPAQFAARTLNGRGIARFAVNDFSGAIADYTQAFRLDPKFSEAIDNRGVVFMANGLMDVAIDDFTTAITLSPTNAHALNNRGRALLEMQACEEAWDDFTAALDLDPADPTTPLFNRGIANECLDDQDAALDDFAAVFELAPDRPDYREKFQQYGLLP